VPAETPDPPPSADSREADLAIRARWILPMEPLGTVLEDHAVLVRGGRVQAVLPAGELSDWKVGEILDRSSHALIPGLVNAHTHAAMTLLRNAAGGLALDDWLRRRIWPLEARLVDERFVEDGTALAIAEMLLGGTTCFADMYYHPDVAARVAARSGMRTCIGLPVLEQPSAWAQDLDEYLDRGLRLRDTYRDDPLVGTLFVLHSPTATGDATLGRVRALSDQLQAPVMTHLLESPTDRAREERRHGRGPLERLAAAGLVNDLLIAVHGVQLNMTEIGQVAEAGTTVVHCPSSNLKLAAGIAPLDELRRAGARVALGTDGAASNDALDMLGEARLAALLAAGTTGDAAVLPPHNALHMATLAGAQALGLGEVTGSIVPGKWADLVSLRLDGPMVQPVHDVASAIVHSAGRSAVCDTWVAGRRLVADGRLGHMSPHELGRRAASWRPRVVAALHAIAGQ
jgi:5-methylthioadenosine/S-adenosylhomocysteine deaminase